MGGLKRVSAACVIALGLGGTVRAGEADTVAPPVPAAAPLVPDVSAAQRAFLCNLVRRTLRDRVLERPDAAPGYVPKSLSTVMGEVVVRLRQRGYLRASGLGGPGPVVAATRDAALAALTSLRRTVTPDAELLSRLMVEIELAGPPVVVPRPEGTSFTDWVRASIEPGVHGVVVVAGRSARRFCPTEVFTSNVPVLRGITRLAQDMGVNPGQTDQLALMRFRTVHWYDDPSVEGPVALFRGVVVLGPEAVGRATLDRAITTLGRYMMYRQLPGGAFSYQYDPSTDRYADENNLVRQAGSAMALCVYDRATRDPGARESADRALAYFLNGVEDVSDDTSAAFIATADGRNKLGVTALVCLALSRHADARDEARASIRHKLVGGMLWLQRPSGLFLTAFPPARSIAAQDYFPGEALFALARDYELEPSTRVNDAFVSAIDFYRDYFQDGRSPAFVPWQVQAFATMARMSKRRDYVDYVFEMTDSLIDKQLTPANCAWPDLWGGIAAHAPGRAGVSTASYLEAFTDALALARDVGDVDRAKRYEAVVRSAARFVMQLQVRPEEAYFMRGREDAIGGIRTSPSLNLLRIDHCQHALIALIKTRRVLFGDQD